MEQLEEGARRPMPQEDTIGMIHKKIVQPAVLNGMETVPMTSSHVKKLSDGDEGVDENAATH